MSMEQARTPVTRQEEVCYYTTTRQDTSCSVTTITNGHEARASGSLQQNIRGCIARHSRRLHSKLNYTASSCRLRFWKSRQLLASLCQNWWLVELLSWCLGAICIFGIAILLAAWNGRPLPDRLPLGIKLNAYVSVLSAIAKLALAVCLEEALATQKYLWYASPSVERPLLDFERFELAARRPVGAVSLIWHFKAKYVWPLVLIWRTSLLRIFTGTQWDPRKCCIDLHMVKSRQRLL